MTFFHPVIEHPRTDPRRPGTERPSCGLNEAEEALASARKPSCSLIPTGLDRWSRQHHEGPIAALDLFRDRAPLFVFAGDVGAGKTALAESFGCALSDEWTSQCCCTASN